MMYDDYSPKDLDKEELFRDYVGKYQYKDINKALDDFNEIYEIINIIGSALQWANFNNINNRDIEHKALYIYNYLARKEILPLNFPFQNGDRYVEFVPEHRGD